MSQWYLNKKGQALGPLSEDKVIQLIKEGEVSGLDLVYEAGSTEWLPISKVNQFSPFLVSSHDKVNVQQDNGQKDWVLLKKNLTDKGKDYQQLGPFSVNQVVSLLDGGEVKFTDFAWKEGYDSWVRIAEVEEFSAPLPSSTQVDKSLYDRTSATKLFNEEEITEKESEEKKSLTHLINIEKFQREKTQVHPPDTSQIESKEEDSFEHFNPYEQTEVDGPINNDEFVTESGYVTDKESSDISLWSLEPPSGNQKDIGEDDEEKTRVTSPITAHIPFKKKEKKKVIKKDKRKGSLNPKLIKMDSEAWQWLIVISAVLLSIYFFYLSLQPKRAEEGYGHLESFKEEVVEIAELQASKKAFKMNEIEAEMAAASKAIEVAKRPLMDDPDDLTESDSMVTHPFDEIKEDVDMGPSTERKIASVKIAPKSEELRLRSEKMKNSKVRNSVKSSSIRSTSSQKVISRPSGGIKAQSYYKQRDRKALFYSSLKAEALAVEIEKKFGVLKKNKKAWDSYYSSWKKRVKNSLAVEIRSFPKQNELYAYPKILSSFKEDYQQFYKYGSLFDAKIKGSRLPSGRSRDMRSVFNKYKKQAMKLGQ